jgi:hypothetical protein
MSWVESTMVVRLETENRGIDENECQTSWHRPESVQ